MYVFWIIVAGVAILLYFLLEFMVTFHVIRQQKDENLKMIGKKGYYAVSGSILAFIILNAAYIGISNYVNAPSNYTCMLLPSIILSLPVGFGISTRLNNTSFK